ncbi:Uma2 family endonuclease [Leptolyngbya sp. NK1-12]|uniref:Uma2 family endonuclease n=1 Tax=Leptolyngbya sp. NK1-12 TaxID=2547451 RepID=A0AA96WMX9_9CYAN|nr:Uma2 family endonuclease [Leptolyngbya sp. NK1-12]WNZ24476.1 Uma2 family endonuclease [Leptolyngbya sp. NK1-12]
MLTTAPTMSLDAFIQRPPDHTEWVDGQLIEKKGVTAKTGRIQAKLARFWGNYKDANKLGGEVYVETPCRTTGRVRCPDVAYLMPDLVAQHGDFRVLPQSFSLIAEVVSPSDEAEEVFTKVREYLASGGAEVWLVMPESQWVLVITANQQILYGPEQTATTQQALPGFTIAVSELIA